MYTFLNHLHYRYNMGHAYEAQIHRLPMKLAIQEMRDPDIFGSLKVNPNSAKELVKSRQILSEVEAWYVSVTA